jgi:hypothetical protein
MGEGAAVQGHHRLTMRRGAGHESRAGRSVQAGQGRWEPLQSQRPSHLGVLLLPRPVESRRAEGSPKGWGNVGKTAVLPPDTPDAPLGSVADVVTLLGLTINQVRRGEIDPKVANAIGYLSATLLRALEQGDIERRLAELEAIIKIQPTPGPDFDPHDNTADPGPAAWEEEVA